MLERDKVLKWYKDRFQKEPNPIRWHEWKIACEIANDFDVLFLPSGDVNYNVLEAIEYAMDTTFLRRQNEYLNKNNNENKRD